MALKWERPPEYIRSQTRGVKLIAYGNGGRYDLHRRHEGMSTGHGRDMWNVDLGGVNLSSVSFTTAAAAKSFAAKFDKGVRKPFVESLNFGEASARLTNPISHLAERPRRMYRSVMSTPTELLLGAAVTAAGLGTFFYVRQKNASAATPTGPAPVSNSITLVNGVNNVRVSGALTINLPSGATWQSATMNGVSVSTPIGFSAPIVVPIATPTTFTVVYVDSTNHPVTATINATNV